MTWLTLLAGCGTPTTFAVPRDGQTFAVGARARVGASTHAPLKRLMMLAVPPVEHVTMVVRDPSVASLEDGVLHVHAPGTTQIDVTGTVQGRRTRVVATIHAAHPAGYRWSHAPHNIDGDVSIAVGDEVRYRVRMVDAQGRPLVTEGLEHNFPPEVTAQPGGSDGLDVKVAPVEVGRIPMTGTAYHFDVVQTWDQVTWSGHVFTVFAGTQKMHFGQNVARQRSLTPDVCEVLPFALGSNPFTVETRGFGPFPERGCRVEIELAGKTLRYGE